MAVFFRQYLQKIACFAPQVFGLHTMIPTPPRQLRIPVLLHGARHNMVVHEWGDVANTKVAICVHGLSRNGRDFDVIANDLSATHRVLCPDVPGRGLSDFLPNAKDYVIPVYAQIMQQMLLQLRIKHYDWIGTSMGGLIGMVIAATPGSTMRRYVCNDVGPEIERAALERIGAYMGMRPPAFESYEQLYRASLLAINSFGPLTDEQKDHIVRSSSAQGEDGKWRYTSDPKIGEAFVAALAHPPADLWPLWSAIRVPTLVLRGEHSDLLSPTTFARMKNGRTNVTTHEVADTGHAPMMMDAPTIHVVTEFIRT
jgi:pimeloyl-ACP methyl ester carboxylesterase